jgi:hypothetical protein
MEASAKVREADVGWIRGKYKPPDARKSSQGFHLTPDHSSLVTGFLTRYPWSCATYPAAAPTASGTQEEKTDAAQAAIRMRRMERFMVFESCWKKARHGCLDKHFRAPIHQWTCSAAPGFSQ